MAYRYMVISYQDMEIFKDSNFFQKGMPILIGIAGASGSGKTTLAKSIIEQVGKDKVLLLSTDNYYKSLAHLTPEERTLNNFDDPKGIDWEEFRKDMNLLLKGKTINLPNYSFITHTREGTTPISPKPIIILEGIFALVDPEVNKHMALKVFVDSPLDLCLLRRMKRDIEERGRTSDSVIEQWEKTVAPSYHKFLYPTSKNAHIIIPECPDGSIRDTATKLLINHIKTI